MKSYLNIPAGQTFEVHTNRSYFIGKVKESGSDCIVFEPGSVQVLNMGDPELYFRKESRAQWCFTRPGTVAINYRHIVSVMDWPFDLPVQSNDDRNPTWA